MLSTTRAWKMGRREHLPAPKVLPRRREHYCASLDFVEHTSLFFKKKKLSTYDNQVF